mgnify:CR=1 FL=1
MCPPMSSWVREGGDTLDRAKGLEGKCVALTFDDGPNEDCTEKLLDGLKERNVRATFFLMGQNIEGNEEIVKRMKQRPFDWKPQLQPCAAYKGRFRRSLPGRGQNQPDDRRDYRREAPIHAPALWGLE